MAQLPENAIRAWENRQGPVVMTTVDQNGMPNTIYVTCVQMISDTQIVIADNKMHKTRENLKSGTPVCLLYITDAKEAFQIKGSARYEREGAVFEGMKSGWLDPEYAGRAAVIVTVEAVYRGAEKLA